MTSSSRRCSGGAVRSTRGGTTGSASRTCEFCDAAGNRSIGQKNVYSVLNRYAAHLHKKGLRAKTISDYMTAVRKFLGYADIKVDQAKFRNKVVMPKVTQLPDVPLRLDDVHCDGEQPE